MKNTKAVIAMVAIAFVIAIGAMAGQTANAAIVATVNLRTAANFSVLAGSEVTNDGPTTTDRKVGVHPGTSVSGFTGAPDGTAGGTIHRGDNVALQAKTDLDLAYDNAAGRTPFASVSGDLGGRSLVGGVYRGGALGLTGRLTLDGQNNPDSVWIFQAASSLITASGSSVRFINGASPCNVFWQIGSSATLGSGSTFVGTIMAHTSITSEGGVTVYGRALARGGLVSLLNDRFLSSACAGGAEVNLPPPMPTFTVAPGTATPVPAPIASFTPAPVATATAAPSATPIATAASSVTPTTAPTAAPVAAVPTVRPAAVAGTQNLPSTSTSDPMWPATILGIALTAAGALLLLRRPIHL